MPVGPRAVVLVALLGPASVRADHDHGAMQAGPSSFGASIAFVAASFDTMIYAGDYQSVVPSARWSNERFFVSAGLPLYRLLENGRTLYGPGDAMIHGRFVALGSTDRARAGVALGVMAPTGDPLTGLGMGHVMVMPSVWGTVRRGDVMLAGAAGFGHALGGSTHQGHGAWPLVEPMNISEVTWTASGELELAVALRAGVVFSGALPVGEGNTRAVTGVRVVWTEGRVETTAAIQAGLAGDPFIFRGVLETALRF